MLLCSSLQLPALCPTGSVCLRTCACCPTLREFRCRPSPRTLCRKTAGMRRRTTPTNASLVRNLPQSLACPPRASRLARCLKGTLSFARRPVRAHDKRIVCEEEFSDSEDEGEGGRRNAASFKKVKRAKTEGDKEGEEKEKKGEEETKGIYSFFLFSISIFQRSCHFCCSLLITRHSVRCTGVVSTLSTRLYWLLFRSFLFF